jgi:hypothetical protein
MSTENTILGTNGNDSLTATNLDDVILALEGDDIIEENLMEGNDTVDGGEGNDTLVINYTSFYGYLNFYLSNYQSNYNGSSNGTLNIESYEPDSGNYNNYPLEFENIETLQIFSNSGDDWFNLAFFNNNVSLDKVIYAGNGNDWIRVSNGNDTVDGGNGFDRLELNFQESNQGVTSSLTGDGSGQYSNGENNSVEFSNIETFAITGSEYDDILAVSPSNATNSSTYFPTDSHVNGGWGNDTLVVNYWGLDVNFNFNIFDYQSNYNGSSNGTLNINYYDPNSGIYNDYPLNFQNIEILQLTSGGGDDWFNFDLAYSNNIPLNKSIDAGGGDDWIRVSNGNDTVDGGEGFDRLELNFQESNQGVTSSLTGDGSGQYSNGENNSVEFSNIETFAITGSEYDDILAVSPSNAPDNSYPYFPTDSEVDGGWGNDTLAINYSSLDSGLNFNIFDYQSNYNGSSNGTLNIHYYNYNSDIYNDYSVNFQNIETIQITSGSGDDWFNFDLAYSNNISLNKSIDAGAGDDWIRVSNGNDTVDGGEGFDRLELNFQESNQGVTSSLTGNGGQYSDGENNSVEFSNIEAFDINGSNYDDVLAVSPSDAPDNSPYFPTDSHVNGREGNDTLVVDYANLESDLNFNLSNHYSYYNGSNDGTLNIHSQLLSPSV